ncbi:MAG: BTAD domain-containing putative transcriptional regulator [Pseudomonadota bacterium]
MKYAKLAHPRLFDALPRPRLFARIDALRSAHPVIWVASPPGAGKTTLIASYLSGTRAASTWYQVDEGDADPATLFFFLGQTVRHLGQPLPYLAPELERDLPRFARMFFREYFARLSDRAVVVLDNAQAFDWERQGHLLEIAFAEVPEGVTVIALSRDAPPARLARLELSGRIGVIGWPEVRLDDSEARQLAQLDKDTADSGDWLHRIDGWAAGVVMLRRRGRASGPAADGMHRAVPEGQEAVFRYFAGEILERLPPASQRVLLLLAGLPGVSASDAQTLTGDPAAGRLLARLFHERLFVDRRGPAPFGYHFHALFREFLQYEAQRRLSSSELAQVTGRAAELLEQQGHIDEAARLYQQAGADARLARLLLASAGTMLSTGRGQAWRNSLEAVPAAARAQEPLLLYWEGASLNQSDPVRAREVLATAEQVFQGRGDALHRALAIAAIIDSLFYEWADFHGLPGWTRKLVEAISALDLQGLDPAHDVHIHSRLGLALCLIEPESPVLAAAVQRVLRALHGVPQAADRLVAGAFLLVYLNWGDTAAARELAFSLAPLAEDPQIAPFHRIFWYRHVAYRHQFDGDLSMAQLTIDRAQKLVSDFGLEQMQFQLHFRHGLNLLGMGRHEEAFALIEQMRPMLSPARRLEVLYMRILESACHAQTGAMMRALEAASDAVQIGAQASLAATTRWQVTMLLAYCHALTGDHALAREWATRGIDAAFGPEKPLATEEADYLGAYLFSLEGDAAGAVELLRRLLQKQRGHGKGFPMLLRVVPQVAQALLGLALREGIELEHVRRQITTSAFQPPNRVDPRWPWPIAVRAFGPMELCFHGQPSKAGGKAQKRPLMLLKALLVAGDAGKPQGTLADQLWPEVEDARAALNVTVHRLRKLLGDDKAVLVTAGKLALDRQCVWTDVHALGQVCSEVEALDCAAAAEHAARLGALLQALYRGPLCADDDESWLIAARDAWRRRYLAAVTRLGEALEYAKDWTAAEGLFRRALEAEPLSESSHRALMRCAHARRDPAAAHAAYRHCRELLSIMLGRAPSKETEDLRVELGLASERT